VRLRGVLLCLDDEPAGVAGIAQWPQHRRVVDRAVARDGEHAVEHGGEKTPVAPERYQAARVWAEAQIGKNYDAKFLWDDDNLYCSELVWKIYQHAGIELCQPRRFSDYHLDDPKVKKVIEERYGAVEKLPKDEKVVAPSDLAGSPLLVEIPRDGS